MGRPKGTMGRNNRKWRVEEKVEIVKKHLDEHMSYFALRDQYQINPGMLHAWVKRYLEGGEKGLERKAKKKHPELAFYRKKDLSETEKLQLENFKLRIENERLKKGYIVKGDGSKKVYIPISKMNTKS